jgi:ornithine cyclodeaminase/alanine dehydrogenase-like protein (mu-crystallin family)
MGTFMPLFLNNREQERCITPREAMDALAHGLRQFACGDAIRRPRIDNLLPSTSHDEYFCFSSMEGGIRDPGYYALRIKPDIYGWQNVGGRMRETTYSYRPGLYGGLVFLYSIKNAEFLAILNDGYVQHLRVAATAGLGIQYLSRKNSSVMGIYGTGGMASFFPLTASAARPIERLQVYSTNRPRLEKYCERLADELDCEIVPMDGPELVCENADIVVACTNSVEPVIDAHWVRPGTHLSNVTHWELSPETCAKVDTTGIFVRRSPPSIAGYVDDDFGIRLNVMAYIAGRPEERAKVPIGRLSADRYPNARIVQCCEWQTGAEYTEQRSDHEITILANCSYGTLEGEVGNSAGIQGIQFASIAGKIYERALELGCGTELPKEMFLQNMPT